MSTLTEAMGKGTKKINIKGREFVLHPLTLNDFCELEAEFGEDWQNKAGMRFTRFMLWLRLRKSDPDLTLEQVGELIDETNFDMLDEILRMTTREEMSQTEESVKNSDGGGQT